MSVINSATNAFSSVGKGLAGAVEGVADKAGSIAGKVVGHTPGGFVLDKLTDGAATRFTEGAFKSVGETVGNGLKAPGNIVTGVATGDFDKIKEGASGAVNLGMAAVPGAGQANLARTVGTNLAKDGAMSSASNEVSKLGA